MKYNFCYKCGKKVEQKYIEGRRREYCSNCEEVLYHNPIPSVAVCGSNPQGELLLVKRKVAPHEGGWCLPGGFVESDETIRETGLRELKEETGLQGEIDRLLGAYSHVNGYYGNILLIGFSVNLKNFDIQAGDDASEVGFFPWSDLPEIVFKIHDRFITQFREIDNNEYDNGPDRY